MDRGLTEEQIKTRMSNQYTQEHKMIDIHKAIDAHGHGNLWVIDNSKDIDNDTLYKKFEEIIW